MNGLVLFSRRIWPQLLTLAVIVGLISVMFAATAWYVVEADWVEIRTFEDLITAIQLTAVGILTFGVCYSFVHYRLGGVKQVEET